MDQRTPVKIVASLHPEGDGSLQLAPGEGKTPVAYVNAAHKAAPLKPEDVPYGAGPTGTCDDVDDAYSGKSGPNPSVDWKSKGQVRKTYHGGVRPDHTLFDSIADEKALAQEPHVCCPNCGQKVKQLDGGTEAYPQPVKKGQYVTGENPEVKDLPPVFRYQLHPCGCRVNQEWATAFTVELNRRKAGETPRAVVDMTEAEREARQKALQEQIGKLYSRKAALERLLAGAQGLSSDEADLFEVECQLVALTDRLMRLVPGQHNLKEDVSVGARVQKWAKENKMAWDGKSKAAQDAEKAAYGSDYPMPQLGALHPPKIDAAVDQLLDHLAQSFGIDPAAFKGQPGGATTFGPAVQTKPVGAPPAPLKEPDWGGPFEAVPYGPGDVTVQADWGKNAFVVFVKNYRWRGYATKADADDEAHKLYQEAGKRPMEMLVTAAGTVESTRPRKLPKKHDVWEFRIPDGSGPDDVRIVGYEVNTGSFSPVAHYAVTVKSVTVGQFGDQADAVAYAETLKQKLAKTAGTVIGSKKAYGDAQGIFANAWQPEDPNAFFKKEDVAKATLKPLPFNFQGGHADRQTEAYRLAVELRKAEPAVRSVTELAVQAKHGLAVFNLVKAFLAQIESGLVNVDGKPATGGTPAHSVQEAAKLLHGDPGVRQAAEQAMLALRSYEAFCVQLITCQVSPGCTVDEAKQLMNVIWAGLRQFAVRALPLPDTAAAFLTAFMDYTTKGASPEKFSVPPRAAPAAAPATPTAPKPRVIAPPPAVPSGTGRPRRVVRVFTPRKGSN